MGWTEEDMRFSSDHAKPWEKLVDACRPFTGQGIYANISPRLKAEWRFFGVAWKGMLPKLIPILQANRQDNVNRATRERRFQHRKCVDNFLSQMR